MKLTAAQLHTVEKQLGKEAVPEENPATPKLKEAFGDHTFFLDGDGLYVIKPESASGSLVRLARWTEDRTGLVPLLEPEVMDVNVVLEQGEPDPAA